jgi:hypothetical protein
LSSPFACPYWQAYPPARKPIAKITVSLRRFLNLLRDWRIDSDFLDAVESTVACVLLVYGALILNKCDGAATRFVDNVLESHSS